VRCLYDNSYIGRELDPPVIQLGWLVQMGRGTKFVGGVYRCGIQIDRDVLW